MRKSLENAVAQCERLGAVVEETSLPTFDHALTVYYIISSAEAASNLSRYDGVKLWTPRRKILTGSLICIYKHATKVSGRRSNAV